MDTMTLFLRFGISLLIGFLIGLEREFSSSKNPDSEIPAGVRTFSLMGILGCLSAHVSYVFGSVAPFIVVLLSVGGFFIINYFIMARNGKVGLTTDVSVIMVILMGALVYHGEINVSVAIAVVIALLLSSKIEMHNFAHLITKQDIYATLKFAVITVIILPILPNKNYGFPPLDVINPFKIWLMVILISGISFVGYFLMKLLGAKRGMGVTGLLGGIASSTAVTLSLAEKSNKNIELSSSFCIAILLSWTIMFSRVFIEVYILNKALIKLIYIPLIACISAGTVYSLILFFSNKKIDKPNNDIILENPFELKPAIKFAIIFSLIIIVSKSAEYYFGKTGIYISSFLGGLADVDAIALSVAELSKTKSVISEIVASKSIVIAAIANTFAKGMLVFFLGSKEIFKLILPAYLAIILSGSVTLFL